MKCLLSSDVLKEKRFRIAGAVIISVFVIVVIVICSTVLKSAKDESNPDNSSTNVPLPFTKALVVQIADSDLWALDIDTNNSTFVVKKWKDRILLFDWYKKETIYIGSRNIGNPIESSSGLYSNITQPSTWSANKIAVDHVNGKVYVLDIAASNINIFDVMGDHYNIVMSHIRGSKDIAVDPIKRKLFILQSSTIVAATIDGSSSRIIVKGTAFTSFAIDHNGKIFYADLENINSVNYTGHEHQVVTNIFDQVISMAAIENNIFWIQKSYDSILHTCKIVNGSCTSISEMPFTEKLIQVKCYNFEKIQISNPCKDRDHACDHMCIMNSQESTRCVCSIGWQLDADVKTCKQANDFLLYIEDNNVKSHILNDTSESFIEAMLPLKLNTKFSTECNFDFIVRERTLFYSDGQNMYQRDLSTNGKEIKLENDEVNNMIIPAVDWISNNLYYLSLEARIFNTWYIKVHNMKNFESFENDKLIFFQTFGTNITSLVVHPNRGLLFCTDISDVPGLKIANIRIIHLDGWTRSKHEDLSVSTDKNVLGIDFKDDRLYWFSIDKKVIHFSDLDINDVRTIDIDFIKSPILINIYKNWLYVSTPTSVWRLDKITGSNSIKILPKYQTESQRIFGAKIFSRDVQPIDKNHPCASNNGDCERYCFGVPSKERTLRKVCDCGKNEELNLDGKTCHLK